MSTTGKGWEEWERKTDRVGLKSAIFREALARATRAVQHCTPTTEVEKGQRPRGQNRKKIAVQMAFMKKAS